MAMAVLLPIFIFGALATVHMYRTLHTSEEKRARDLVSEISRQTTYLMRTLTRNLHPITSNPILRDGGQDEKKLIAEMNRLVDDFALYRDISLYSPEGYLSCSTSPRLPEFKETTSWFRLAVTGEMVVSTPQFDVGQTTPNLWVYVPMKDDKGRLSHVIKARIPFSAVSELIEGVRFGATGRMLLLDGSGNVISGPGADKTFRRFDERHTAFYWAINSGGDYEGNDGVKYSVHSEIMASSQTMVGEPWTLLLLRSRAEVDRLVYGALRYQIAGGAMVLLISMGLGWILAQHISRPITSAAEAAAAFGAGNLDARIQLSGIKEVNVLSKAFDTMAREVIEVRRDLEDKVRDRTANLAASEKRLREIGAQLRAAYESSREAILVVGADGKILAANRRFEEFFGISATATLGKELEDLKYSVVEHLDGEEHFEEQWGRLAETEGLATVDDEWILVKPTRRLLKAFASVIRTEDGANTGRLIMWYDVTEERELQKELQESQKMEAVGRLAGGVAHDFNNLLAAISGSISLAEKELDQGEMGEARDLLHNASTAATGGKNLVKQLLGYSRRNKLTIETWPLDALAEEMRSLLSRTISPLIELQVQSSADLWPVKADRSRIHQVLMNLCVNAADALKGRPNARVTISADNAPGLRRPGPDKGGVEEFVRLRVMDNGTGIPESVRSRMFEPFFTTKPAGQGTGLGLATCMGIAQQHGGWIECDSLEGKGTTFSVYLPRGYVEEMAKPLEAAPRKEAESKGGESILIVDDDLLVRTVAERTLASSGYKVTTAGDGLEALSFLEQNPAGADLVLLDLTMPRMSGPETIQHLREDFPDLPVVICSGFLLDLPSFRNEHGVVPEDHIQKPYDLGDLKNVVRRVLDDKAIGRHRAAA